MLKGIQEWFNERIGSKTVAALKKNRFKAEYVATRKEARQKLLAMIPSGATIGVGGSITVAQLDILDELKERGNVFFDHNRPGLSQEEKNQMRRRQLTADVFLTGTNAVTIDGKLVNVDGNGNRVAAMIFGPRQVIVVAGSNKIVKDVESALERIEQVAAPKNCRRLNYANPCLTTGFCSDCDSPQRICNVTAIMRKKPTQTDLTVIIIGEELGL